MFSDYVIERSSLVVAVYCSGSDRPLKPTDIKDLFGTVRSISITPVFIYDRQPDPLVRETAAYYAALMISVQELDSIDQAMSKIPPKVRGSIDRISLDGRVSGWALLYPTNEAAIVRLVLDNQALGSEAVANGYRKDLIKFGNGCFGFCLDGRPTTFSSNLLSSVGVQVFYNSHKLLTLRPSQTTRIM